MHGPRPVSRRHPKTRPGAARLRPVPALLLPVLALWGCAGVGSEAENPFDSRAGSNQIEIQVQNLNWHDATLHAHRGGVRQRLGIVTGKSDATFTMGWSQLLPLQIEIDLLASGSCITRPLQVAPGEIVVLHIETRLEMDPDCRTLARR